MNHVFALLRINAIRILLVSFSIALIICIVIALYVLYPRSYPHLFLSFTARIENDEAIIETDNKTSWGYCCGYYSEISDCVLTIHPYVSLMPYNKKDKVIRIKLNSIKVSEIRIISYSGEEEIIWKTNNK